MKVYTIFRKKIKIDTGNLIQDLIRWQYFFIDNLKMRNKSIHTIKSFSIKIEDFIEFCRTQDEIGKISEFNKMFINLFILQTRESILKRKPKNKKSVSNWTINTYITALRVFFSFISDNNDEFIDLMPLFQKLKPLKVETEVLRFTPEENNKILSQLQKEKQSKNIKKIRNIAGIYILYFCGLRASELLNIKLEDISVISDDFFNIKVNGKGNKIRNVQIRKAILGDLLHQICINLKDKDRLFPITYSTLYNNTNAF
ncbi:tyrosine-type recombinase/integrase [Helicobacter sp. 13S00477-4]|uniref:tyrosine-type recombinase/integrase n=1 Tax=Helicobacter sp. 13S00477-4 TaxID=1905759 RepID=UPI000BA5C2FA|nr:tyrosine-type recombinase/integrase [Helicobacter sp. 13S00477-4]PAF50324.1 hypothetical protein BKH44_08500 [Helicobacter sp. 13S00477-4]